MMFPLRISVLYEDIRLVLKILIMNSLNVICKYTFRHTRIGAEPINSETLASINADVQDAQDLNDVLYERQAQKADFIRTHTSYDKTFWIFSQKNKLRQFCQRLVQPANGDCIFGLPHSPLSI